MNDSDARQRWADLTPEQQARLLRLADLHAEEVEDMIETAKSRRFWITAANRFWQAKWVILLIGAGIAYFNGGWAALTGFFTKYVLPLAL